MNKKSKPSNANLLFEELEPRILLSADGLAVITESSVATTQELALGNDELNTLIVQNHVEQTSVVVQAKHNSSELVIIDSRAPNFQQLHNDIIHAQQQGRNIQVFVLDAHRDGIEQISEALTTYNKLDAVHIVSHGESGKLQLGATQLDKQNIKHRTDEIKQWQQAFVNSGDLLLYGCNLAGSANGQSLVDALAKHTAADVAASDDLTGNAILGGDWELEYQTGEIESSIAFSADVQQNWQGTLEVSAPSGTEAQQTLSEEAALQEQLNEEQQAAIVEQEQAAAKIIEEKQQAALAEEQRLEFVFIDESVDDYQSFVDDLNKNNDSINFEIILLDSQRDGIEQISETLSAYNDVDAVHILSHGNDGSVKLGDTWLSANNLDEYSDSINAWGNSLDESADILIYGCNLAESESGEQFVNELAQLTGADVAASDDVTGQALLGGDWELEYQVGSVEAQTVVSAELQQTYESILATETVIDDFSTGDFTGNTGSQLWTADWIEVDAGGAGAATGNVIVTGGEVSISTLGSSLAREVDLSGATTATFSFDFHTGAGVEAADPDSLVVEVSDDGGATWTTLEDINYLTGVNSGSKSYDISAYTAVDTQIRFRANAGYGGPDEFFYVDDVQIEYTTNSAPLNSVPGAQTTDEDTNLVFNAANSNLIFISDADAGINPLEVTLTVNDGVLTLSGTTGLTFVTGSDGSTTMTFTGTLSDINTALDGLTFTPDANFSGSASLQITTHDDGTLLASYSFDDVGNLGADNSTGTVYDGNATGAISVNDATRGDVLSLDGSTHIEIPGFFGNPVDATLAAWVNLTTYDDNGTDIISLGDNIILRYQDYNNSLNGAYYDGATWQSINFLTTINLAGDGWHHVAYSVDDTNNTHTIYFDGVEVASAAMTGSVAYTNGTNSYIGAHGELSPEWDLIGLVDDVRIYDNALTSSEIISVMNNPPGKDSDTVAITVTAVNDAPVLDNTGNMSLSNIKENEIDSSGDLVSDIIASAVGDRITDADAGAVEGIAVTVVDNTNGTWEYSTDGGTNWTAFGSVTNTSAVLLTATGSDRIRFVPSASFSGVVNLSFHAWDTTDGLVSGTTSVDVSSNGGSTAFSSATEDVRVEVLPVEIRILFTTDKDINSSGVPGITSWTTGDVLAIGDPNLSFEPLGSDGSVYRYFNLDTFASDGDMQMQGLHFVSRDVTVGSANSVDLQRGDILFISSNGETMTSTNSLTFAGGDVIAFRPDTPDDYSSGTFIHVLDQPGIQQTTGITLVEADTLVGDITLLGGSFLFTQADSGSGEANNIYHYSADDAGAGTTTGTVSTFITGTDINIDFNEFIGVMLVTQDTPLNGTTVSAGTIITTLANGDSFTGDNSIATNEDEVLTLDVTTTTMGSGTSAADVTVLFDGGDIGLNNNNKKMRSLAFIEIVGPVNVEPVITLPGSGINYTENDPPAVIDATATLVDPDSADFDGGILRVEIASNGTANDRLSVQNEGTAAGQVGVSGNNVTYGGTVIGNFLGGTSASDPLFVYFDANADVTAVQAVMRNITYENTSTSPSIAQRTVNFVISDGDLGTSAVVSTTIDVIDVVTSNAPVATNDPGGYSATVSSYNPPSYWSFDETSGTTASDNGNTANDGTFNGVTLGQTGAINGDTGTAIGFDGSNDYVVMPHDDAYLIDDGTVQLWFNANDLLTDQGLISKDSSGFDTGGHFTIRTLTDGSIEVRLQSTVDSNFLSSGAGTVTAGSWHHVAVTFGAGGMELFLDGVSVDTNPYTGGMGTTSGGIGNYEPIAIGASTRVSGNGTVTPLQDFFGGSIDEVAIIDQTLTAEQIQDIYASALQNYTILEDTSLVVSAAEGVLINDSDADGDSLTAVLVAGPSNAASFTLNADGSFSYTPLANFSGTDTFTYMANDGSTNSNVATVTITVNGDNDAPVNTVPGTQTVVEDTQTAIAGLSVADPDAGAGVMTTQLSVTNGVLDVTLSGAATISAGANSSGSMTISGNVTDINATLASLQYMGNLNVNGVAADTLIMVTNDLGNTGTGGALSDTDNVQIDITAVNDVPVARDDRIGLVFDGVDDYVRIGDYAGLTVTTNMTMEAWIKPTGLGTGSKIIINKEGEYELGITADTGEIKWAFDNIDPDWSWHNTGYFAQAGEWTHIAVTYNNGVVNTYANGVVVDTYNGSGAIADNYLAMNELNIGGRENAVTQRFDGQIDEVRIWNTTRAQIDIQNDMNSLLTGVEAGLIGNWRFDEGSGTTVVDQSALGHDGTLADGVTVAEMPSWQGYVVSEEGTLNVNAVNGVLPNDYDIDGDILTAVLDSAPVNAAAFTLNPDGSFTYTPTANFNGIDSFTYHVNDGSADSNIATVTIRVDPVNDTPTTSPVTLTAIAEDSGVRLITQAELLANAADDDGDVLTATGLSISAGLGTLFDNGDGTWNYTPALNDDTSVSFSYTITDGVAPIAGSASLDITPLNDTPTTSPVTLTAIAEDSGVRLITQAELLANAADDDGDALTATGLSISAGLGTLFDNGDGTWNYTPALNDDTSVSFSYTITDGVAPIAGSASLDITPVNNAPTTTPVTLVAISEDSGVRLITQAELLANAGDVDGDALTATGLSISAGLGTLFDNGDGTWNYTPALNDDTSVSFSYTITDGVAPIAGSASLDITPLNDTPTTSPVTLTAIAEDSGVRLITQAELLANAADDDGDVLTATGLSISAGLGTLFDNGDGTWNYTPALNDDTSVSFSYTITDGVAPIAGSATLDITPLNDAPVAGNDLPAAVDEGGTVIIDLVANDVDIDNALDLSSIVITVAPGSGALTDNGDGTVSYIHDGSETLSDSFSYTIADITGAVSNTATVNFTVNPLNDAPSALADAQTVNEGGTVNIDLAANDVDVDNALDLSSIVIVGVPPANGTLTVNANGTVDYTHDGSQTTSDNFTYTIADVSGAISNVATVNITVNPVNNAPTTIGIVDVTVAEDSVATSIDLNSVFDDVDNLDSELTYSITGNTSIGLFSTTAINAVTGELVLEYAADMNGSSQIAVRAIDPSGASVETLFTVMVTPVNDAPVMVANSGMSAVGTTNAVITNTELNVSDIDNANNSLTYTVTALPTNGVLMVNGVPVMVNDSFTEDDIVNNRLSYQADATSVNDQFAFIVTDGAGGSISSNTFNIVVQVAPPAPEPIDPVDPPTPTVTPVVPEVEPPSDIGGSVSDPVSTRELEDIYAGGATSTRPQPGLTLEPVQHIALDQAKEVQSDFGGHEVNKSAEVNFSTVSTVADIQVKSIKALWIAIDEMKQQIDEDVTENMTQVEFRAAAVSSSGVALTAGVVAWVLRSGALLTSLMSTIPLWKGYDPLPILAYRDDDDEKEKNVSEDKIPTSLEELKKVKALREKMKKENQVDSMFGDGKLPE